MPAIRLNAVNFNVARVIGPVAGSLVLTTWGYRSTFALNALSFLVVIVGLLLVRPRRIVYSGGHEPWLRAFMTSVDYVRSRQSMRQLMVFSFMLSVFGASVWQLTAGLVAEDYHAPESGIGFLIASFGVGASTSGFILLARGDRFRRSRMTLAGISGYSLGALARGDHAVHRGGADRIRVDGGRAQPRRRGIDLDLANTGVGEISAAGCWRCSS